MMGTKKLEISDKVCTSAYREHLEHTLKYAPVFMHAHVCTHPHTE
jgi:hypothetical protein